MGRVLAIDYGRARIGLALSDPLGITVRPLPALANQGTGATMNALERLVVEEQVDRLVLGLPLTLDGKEGPACQEVRRFAEQLVQRFPRLPLEQVDERLTSKHAHALLKGAGLKARRRAELADSTAAVLLLQSYLQRSKRPT